MPQDTEADVRLILEADLTIRTVDIIRATLRSAIEPPFGAIPADIAIDCSAAADIDLTFIQLLIAARLSIRTAGRQIRFASCPDGVLLDTLTRGGFRVVPEEDGGFWFTGEAA
jgi:anti-anti-sigma regulatory factor